jgi:hypothetical protein
MRMISNNAKQTIDQMVLRAIRASPLLRPDVSRFIDVQSNLARLATEQAVVLTVSSYVFRLTFMIHFSSDDLTRAHFAALNPVAASDLDDREYLDAIRECGNVCCGNLNRDLVRFFPHVGMSTPNIIDRRCVDYIDKLGEGYVQHFVLSDEAGPPFAVTVCVNAFAEIDFTGDFADTEETGALEMF